MFVMDALDICSPGAAIGVGFGRIANFIRPEPWGRPTGVPWAMVFPGAGPLPRHPSQSTRPFLKGSCFLSFSVFAIRRGALKRPGFVIGLFASVMAQRESICEFFKEPDPDLFNFSFGLTMGMILSIPTLIAGAVVMVRAAYRRE